MIRNYSPCLQFFPSYPVFLTQMGYPYSVRREHYRRDPWYVMVKKGKDSIYIVLREPQSSPVSKEMLIVGRNLDRNGQTLAYLSYSDSFYTYLTLILSILTLILSHLLLFYSDYSYLLYSETRWISHLESYIYDLLKRQGT